MNVLSTRFHAKIDYIAGIVFIASPWIFGFNESTTATWIPIVVGATALVMSLFTDYEGGMVRSIPMSIHLAVDVISGVFLAASPWLFGFADEVYLPHLILGIFAIGSGLLTSRHPSPERSERVS